MGASREKDQADFDLERFVDMFDEAMTSRDPRVMKTLRDLMMIVTLTKPESNDSGPVDRQRGPLRRLFEDMNHLHRRLERMEYELQQIRNHTSRSMDDPKYPYEKYTLQASQALAADIDRSILAGIQGLNATQVKGLLDK